MKVKVLAGLSSFWEPLRETLFPYLFQLLETVCIPLLIVPFLYFQSQQQQAKFSYTNISVVFCRWKRLFALKDPCEYIVPTWMIRVEHPISKCLT